MRVLGIENRGMSKQLNLIFVPCNANYQDKVLSIVDALHISNTQYSVFEGSDEKAFFKEMKKPFRLAVFIIDINGDSILAPRKRKLPEEMFRAELRPFLGKIIEKSDKLKAVFFIRLGSRSVIPPIYINKLLNSLSDKNLMMISCKELSEITKMCQDILDQFAPKLKEANPYMKRFSDLVDECPENIKGKVFVTLAYIAASQDGLSNDEICGLVGISLDQWNAIYAHVGSFCMESGGLYDFLHDDYKNSFLDILDPSVLLSIRKNIADYFRNSNNSDTCLKVLDKKLYFFVNQIIIHNNKENSTCSFAPSSIYKQVKKSKDELHENVHSLREIEEVAFQYYSLGLWRPLYSYITDLEVFNELFKSDIFGLEKYWKALLGEGFSLKSYETAVSEEKDKRFLCEVLNNLGILCGFYLNFHPLALSFLQSSLKLRSVYFGNDNEMTLETLINIGTVYYLEEDYKEALSYFNKVLSVKKQFYGMSVHPGFLEAYTNITMVYNAMCDYESARKYSGRIENIIQKMKSEEEILFSFETIYFVLGETNNLSGHYPEARDYYRKAVDKAILYRKPEVEMCYLYNQLGNAYISNGEYKEAFEIHSKNLEIRKKYNTSPEDIATSFYNLGRTCYFMKDISATEMYLKKDNDLNSENRYFQALNLWWQAKCLMLKNKLKRAQELLNSALIIMQTRPNELLEHHLEIYLSLSECLLLLGNINEAEDNVNSAKRLYEQRFGADDHPLKAYVYERIGDIVYAKQKDAVPFYKQAQKVMATFVRPNHPYLQQLKLKIEIVDIHSA